MVLGLIFVSKAFIDHNYLGIQTPIEVTFYLIFFEQKTVSTHICSTHFSDPQLSVISKHDESNLTMKVIP